MNTTEIFEIFNHCASQKDPAQMLELSNDLELFTSDSFSDGKIYYGEDAPEAFRNSFRELCESPGVFTMRVKHKTGGTSAATYVCDLRNGGALSTSLIQFTIVKKKLAAFIQTSS
ncbi:MAG: hypothetical protein HKN36_12595 [Hellea sp.]|nr:hypothetical protein [Hellea sp.]